MGWEIRNGRRVYYRKRRVRGKVVSVYCGSGDDGERAAAADQERRELAAASRKADQQLAADLDRLDWLTHSLTVVQLEASGYYSHKGEWRRGRDRQTSSER